MSNQLRMMRAHAARAGMGGIFLDSSPAGNFPSGSLPQWGTVGSGGSNLPQWETVGSGGSSGGGGGNDWWKGLIKDGVNIFGQYVQAKKAQPRQAYDPSVYTPTPGAPPPGSSVATGVQATLDSFAAQFGVSSTTLLLLGAAGVYLLLKPAPARR